MNTSSSKTLITPKTHSLVVDMLGQPTIYDGKVLLHNTPANCLVEVPLTERIKQMFKLHEHDMNPPDIEFDASSQTDTFAQTEKETYETEVTEDLIELLISEISKRPPLYNEKLPLHKRSRSIKMTLEKEVFEALGGQMPLEDISKKWAYLKKEYKRHRQQLNKYVKSGCSLEEAVRITGKPLWKHYKSLMFIDDIIDDAATQSNVPLELPSPSGSSSMASPIQCDTPVSKKRKANNVEENTMPLLDQMIIGELNKNTNKQDSCDHFCMMLALEMKKLDSRKRAELQIEFLTMLNEVLHN